MSRMRKGIKWLLALSVLLAGFTGFQARAQMEDSVCNAMADISIKNINLRAGDFTRGQELQRVSSVIRYSCKIEYAFNSPGYRPTLRINKAIKSVIDVLNYAGLGMDVIVQEGSQAPVTVTWQELLSIINGGHTSTRPFGAGLPNPFPPKEEPYELQGLLTLRIFVDAPFSANQAQSISVPGSAAFNILAYNPVGQSPQFRDGTPIKTSGFHVRFIPDNAGRVEVSPSLVRLGHFYTSQESSLSKRVPFTVTARQNTGVNGAFTAPLAVKFSTGGLVLEEANQTVVLSNADGIPNGLKLALEYDALKRVTFNESERMGDIQMKTTGDGSISRTYTAVVERIPGADMRPGKFSAPMAVIVTWN